MAIDPAKVEIHGDLSRADVLVLAEICTNKNVIEFGVGGSTLPGAAGPNSSSCFALGVGPFQRGAVGAGLELIPDEGPTNVDHGVLAPVEVVPLVEYQADLRNTRAAWQIGET